MHYRRSRVFIGLFLTIFALIGVVLNPITSMTTSAAEDYRLWRQSDSRWASITLGSSSETMSKSGCLVTSIAILAVHSGAKNADSFNPGTLANSLNSVSAFSNGAIASWSKLTEVLPDVKFVKKYTFTSATQSGKASEMKSIQNEGYYMICNVGNHWVFIDSIVGSDVYMIDPAKNDTKLFGAYSLSAVTELRVFTGKNPPKSTNAPAATTAPTTPSAVPTTAAPTTEKILLGEYYAGDYDFINIYNSSSGDSSVLEYLYSGQLVNITEIKNGRGCFQLGAEKGWIDIDHLIYAGNPTVHKAGDINDDGVVDNLDLALLNEYLGSLSELPDGISILRECELKAGDINGDGVADNNDVLEYLAIICK